jgi:hypothetical protein
LSLVLWQVGVSARPMNGYSGSVGLYTLLLDRIILWTQRHLRWHISRSIRLLTESLIPGILLGTGPEQLVGALGTRGFLGLTKYGIYL